MIRDDIKSKIQEGYDNGGEVVASQGTPLMPEVPQKDPTEIDTDSITLSASLLKDLLEFAGADSIASDNIVANAKSIGVSPITSEYLTDLTGAAEYERAPEVDAEDMISLYTPKSAVMESFMSRMKEAERNSVSDVDVDIDDELDVDEEELEDEIEDIEWVSKDLGHAVSDVEEIIDDVDDGQSISVDASAFDPNSDGISVHQELINIQNRITDLTNKLIVEPIEE